MNGETTVDEVLAAYRAEVGRLHGERDRLREALEEMVRWADEVRGHYGIEEVSGVGQPATAWDEAQDGLRRAAIAGGEALNATKEQRP